MAILEETKEYLSFLGTEKSSNAFDEIIQTAHRNHASFNTYFIDPNSYEPVYMDKDANFCFHSNDRTNAKKTDITKYGLTQAANIWGIPAKYLSDLYEKGLSDLAVKNINTLNKYNMSGENPRKVQGKVLVSDGVCEAITSLKFAQNFPVCDVLETVKKRVGDRYQPNQAYLSKSKMHMRFLDIDNPVDVGGEKMTVGFTISSSDIGKSALKVNFFLYKFACKNGIVIVGKSNYGGRMAGTLYKQKHLGEAFDAASIQRFNDCFDSVELLRQNGLDAIASSQRRMMSEDEMNRIIDSCRKNYVSVDEKERDKILDLAFGRYGRTKWGLINGITEVAQDHELEDRLAYETWAGNILQFVA